MQRILDAITSVEAFIAEQRSIAGADSEKFTDDQKTTQKASKIFVQSPALNGAVDALNALVFAARDLLPTAATHVARLARAKVDLAAAQKELDAQPAPGTDAARAKVESAKAAVAAIEAEPAPAKPAAAPKPPAH